MLSWDFSQLHMCLLSWDVLPRIPTPSLKSAGLRHEANKAYHISFRPGVNTSLPVTPEPLPLRWSNVGWFSGWKHICLGWSVIVNIAFIVYKTYSWTVLKIQILLSYHMQSTYLEPLMLKIGMCNNILNTGPYECVWGRGDGGGVAIHWGRGRGCHLPNDKHFYIA